jgi:hypothetical protein
MHHIVTRDTKKESAHFFLCLCTRMLVCLLLLRLVLGETRRECLGIPIENGTLMYTGFSELFGNHLKNHRYGNFLSQYFHARTLAYLGNLDFKWVDHKKVADDVFVRAYPKLYRKEWYEEESEAPYLKHTNFVNKQQVFDDLCDKRCQPTGFPHEFCPTWYMLPELMYRETKRMIHRWHKKHPEIDLPKMESNTVYIFDRCAGDTFLKHEIYGPMGFQNYLLAPRHTRKFKLIHSVEGVTSFCETYRGWRTAFLLKHFPEAIVEDHDDRNSAFYDFVQLARAPFIFSETSSFSLYALMSNPNRVIMPPFAAIERSKTPTASHILITGQTLLPATARDPKGPLNFTHRCCIGDDDPLLDPVKVEKIKHWLENH